MFENEDRTTILDDEIGTKLDAFKLCSSKG